MNIRHHLLLSSLIAALVLLATGAPLGAQTAMYMKFDTGTAIEGSVVRSSPGGLDKSIDVLSYSFGGARPVTVGGGQGGPQVGTPQISEFTITAPFDGRAYAKLVRESLLGEDRKIGVLSVVAGSNEDPFVPLTIELDGVVSSFSASQAAGDDGGGFMSITITLTKIKVTTRSLDAQGGVGEPQHFTWDAVTQIGE